MQEPTLRALTQANLKWIFVGGKGGVGKTTTSCSLATLLASSGTVVDAKTKQERPKRVLLISTDPAHNLSDAFNQQFTNQPTLVTGTTNLFAMESDPSTMAAKGNPFLNELHDAAVANKDETGGDSSSSSSSNPMKELMRTLGETMKALPGVDELSVFSFILRDERVGSFDVVIFDTAPTGHTLRLLAMPQTVGTAFDKVSGASSDAASSSRESSSGGGLGGLLQMAGQLISMATGVGQNTLAEKFKQWREDIRTVQTQFQDATTTAFVCVCIPEFLSLYETDRLIQELTKFRIQCDHVVVNQLVMRPSGEAPCKMCAARQKIQGKYLSQILELYGEDFHVVKMPLHADEVRGLAMLQKFAKFLAEPYEVEKHGYL